MRGWQKLVVVIIPAVILVAIGFAMFHKKPRGTVQMKTAQQKMESNVTSAQAKLPKKPNIDSMQSAQQLAGKQVWMLDGYVFDYFPYRHGRVDYARPEGKLPGMQQMKIEKIVTQRKPPRVKTQVPAGSEQVLAVFTTPGSQHTYALPIGYKVGKKTLFDCEQMFYFNDPHQVYHRWPQSAWTAIEQHKVVPGMTELQAQAALGANQKVKTGTNGEQIVTYQTKKKKWTVTFKNDKAVSVAKG